MCGGGQVGKQAGVWGTSYRCPLPHVCIGHHWCVLVPPLLPLQMCGGRHIVVNHIGADLLPRTAYIPQVTHTLAGHD